MWPEPSDVGGIQGRGPLLLWVLAASTLDVACDHSLDRALCESRTGTRGAELCGRCLAEALAAKERAVSAAKKWAGRGKRAMGEWDALPRELQTHIWWLAVRARAAERVQAAWRRYRAYVLVRRYGMLLHVREFRAWNPTLRAFLARARL